MARELQTHRRVRHRLGGLPGTREGRRPAIPPVEGGRRPAGRRLREGRRADPGEVPGPGRPVRRADAEDARRTGRPVRQGAAANGGGQEAARRPGRAVRAQDAAAPEPGAVLPGSAARLSEANRELEAIRKTAPPVVSVLSVDEGAKYPEVKADGRPRNLFVQVRGSYLTPGEEAPPVFPRILAGEAARAVRRRRGRRPARRDESDAVRTCPKRERAVGIGEVDHGPEAPADGPRVRQPGLAAPLRRGDGRTPGRLRRARRAADAPGAARLAGRTVRRGRLVGQEAAPAHPALAGLPDVGDRRRRRRAVTRRTGSSGTSTAAGWRPSRSATPSSPWPARSTRGSAGRS